MNKQIILMDRPRMKRALKRIAIQVWERFKSEEADSELVLIGLNERGFATATEIANSLENLMEEKIEIFQYHVDGEGQRGDFPDCNDKFVFLIDDVIFSGKTMFSALSAVCNIYDPSSIEIAVLLDRGHRKYPLRTELKGMTVPTKLAEHIEVMLKDGHLDQAILFKNQ